MIVLDTHIWIWWVDDNARLTQKHRDWIQQYQSQGLGVSIISCWEVSKLVEMGRLTLFIPLTVLCDRSFLAVSQKQVPPLSLVP